MVLHHSRHSILHFIFSCWVSCFSYSSCLEPSVKQLTTYVLRRRSLVNSEISKKLALKSIYLELEDYYKRLAAIDISNQCVMITWSGQCLKTNGTEKEKDNSSSSHVLHHRIQKLHEKVSYSLLIWMYRETKKNFKLIWCQLSLSLNPFHFMFCMFYSFLPWHTEIFEFYHYCTA